MNHGTYNNNCNSVYSSTNDSYSSSSYEHYQYHHHHYYQDQMYPHSDYCSTSNRIENLPKQYNTVSYYDSVLGYEYNSSDLGNLRRTDESHYYPLQHQHYHNQDDVNIITSSNGLSYTNLDYNNTENFSYHNKTTPLKEYVNYEALDAKRESDTRGQAQNECHETMDYLNQSAITDEQYQSTTYNSPVKEESHYHPHSTSSALNSLPDYHHQAIALPHMHHSPHHHHHQPQHINPTTQTQSTHPTYKWMQVKRNVPKPGKFL